jgi:hypothetical protein
MCVSTVSTLIRARSIARSSSVKKRQSSGKSQTKNLERIATTQVTAPLTLDYFLRGGYFDDEDPSPAGFSTEPVHFGDGEG